MSDEQQSVSVGTPPDAGHPPQPKVGTWTRKSDGAPADLFQKSDYPLVGVCMHCEGPIYVESFIDQWKHVE